jgi:hypothetical protein
MVMPWLLGDVAASFAMQQIPEFNRIVPLVAVSIATAILAVLANWRFAREEF